MEWSYEIHPDKGVTVKLNGKPFSSRHHADSSSAHALSLNALKSVKFLYELGNGLILDNNIGIETSINISRMIQKAVAELVST
jgi:hypothetical protein